MCPFKKKKKKKHLIKIEIYLVVYLSLSQFECTYTSSARGNIVSTATVGTLALY